ncbi:hypothetical protein N9004_03565 [Pirellulales bacterium]|nr:hypothetical protein [Pirellulales bacterium]
MTSFTGSGQSVNKNRRYPRLPEPEERICRNNCHVPYDQQPIHPDESIQVPGDRYSYDCSSPTAAAAR